MRPTWMLIQNKVFLILTHPPVAQEYSEQLLQKLTDTTQSWSSASFERQTALVQQFETDMLRSPALLVSAAEFLERASDSA